MPYFSTGGQVHKVSESATIGRSLNSNIVIGDLQVSKTHARVVKAGDEQYIITDLDSRNGTFVNGLRITEPTRIKAKDRVAIGATNLVFHLDTPEILQTSFPTVGKYISHEESIAA